MVDYCLLTVILMAFGAYAVFGGADFGAGVWEINNRLRTDEKDKRLIYRAIGPVWEANHVWLIFGITAVWTCYPQEFQRLCIVGSFLLAVALIGIVLRGASYAFRSTGQPGTRSWEILFAVASTLTPFSFGCLTGILSDDQLPQYALKTNHWQFVDNPPIERNALTDWISFPSLYLGFFAVGLCAYLASIFLVREAANSGDRELESRWRSHAILMSWVTGAFSIGGLAISAIYFSSVWEGMLQSAWFVVGLGVLCGIATLPALLSRRYWTASATAALAVVFILVAWVIGQIQSGHTFGVGFSAQDPKTTDHVRWLLFSCMVGGILLIAPPMIWLFYIFKAEARLESGREPEEQPVQH